MHEETRIDVSVVITTYNRLWCLPRAIESCKKNVCHTEIIVVDDGSTDGTWEWLQKQPDIIPLWQHNQGQTYAINNGVAHSSGTYIRFLDSDDFLCECIIDKQFGKAIETGATLVCSRVDNFDNKSSETSTNPEINSWNDFLEIQLGNSYGSHFLGMLFHRELIAKVPRRPDYAFREDRMFLLEIGILNPQLAIVEGCAGYWVKHEHQMQGNYRGLKAQVTNFQHLNIYKKILCQLATEGRLFLNYKKAACTVLWPLAHWIAIDFLHEAQEVVDWIYELDPDFIIPDNGMLGWLYQATGFNNTEKILGARRVLKGLFK